MEKLFTVNVFEKSKFLKPKKVQEHKRCNYRKASQIKSRCESQGYTAQITQE